MTQQTLIDAASDLDRLSLKDARLDRRCLAIVQALQRKPTASFTEALGSDAASEGFYRFMRNDKVEWRALADEHRDATHERALQEGRILALHDTSLCQFGGDVVREGTFRTAKGKSGFLAHTCLAVSADGSRQPLGVLGMLPVVRLSDEDAADSPGWRYSNESARWADLVAIVEDERPDPLELVHVMDSEGDAYDLLEFMASQDYDFVVRLCHDRRTLAETGDVERLLQRVQSATARLSRSVTLSGRKPGKTTPKSDRHAPRDERIATLDIRTTNANLLRPEASESYLVPHRSGFDQLALRQRSTGNSSGASRTRRLRGVRGSRLMKPLRSSCTTIEWTDGGVTLK